MKKLYSYYVKLEELLCAIALVLVTVLIFAQAVMRTIKMPINWGQDIALLLFPWIVFIGADLALRETDFVSVDMITSRFPKKIQSFLYYLWYAIVLIFLVILIYNSFPIMEANYLRNFSAIGVSYNYAVLSCPVGCVMIIFTIILKLVKRLKQKEVKDGEK